MMTGRRKSTVATGFPKMLPSNPLLQLTERLVKLEKRLAKLERDVPLFDVQNEDTPAQFTGDQNNYDPGNYDTLRVSSNASRTVTGIAQGRKGRRILWANVGSNNIVFAHQSGSSTDINRIITSDGASFTLAADELCITYYDSTAQRWRLGTTF